MINLSSKMIGKSMNATKMMANSTIILLILLLLKGAICQGCPSRTGMNTSTGTCYPCIDGLCDLCVANNQACTGCLGGYGFNSTSGLCHGCAVSYCANCGPDFNGCIACSLRYGLNATSACVSCTDTNCDNCSFSAYTCISCLPRHGLLGAVCVNCTDQYCYNCAVDFTHCVNCEGFFGMNAAGVCTPCAILNCMICDPDYTICLACNTTFGLNPAGQCSPCVQLDCYICSTNKDKCQDCYPPAGVNMTQPARLCQPCTDPSCMDCSRDNTKCQACDLGFGVNSGYGCQPCATPQPVCYNCSFAFDRCVDCPVGQGLSAGNCMPCTTLYCSDCKANYLICVQCAIAYSFNGTVCDPCNPPCLTCNASLTVNDCLSCVVGYYYDVLNLTCIPCTAPCVDCTSAIFCNACDVGSYITAAHICMPCPQNCSACSPDPTFTSVNCTSCVANCYNDYIVMGGNNVTRCIVDICGDNYNIIYPCDNQLGIPYDGCDDNCQFMNNFTCWTNNITFKTICSYNGTVSISYIGIQKPNINNQLNIKFYVYPPLNYFQKTSSSQLMLIFGISSVNMTVQQVQYDPINSIVTVKVAYFDDLFDSTINITFNPSQGYSLQYAYTQDQIYQISVNLNLSPIYYVSNTDRMLGMIFKYVCYFIVVIAWFGCIVGFYTRKLAGIQAMFVLQFAWINFMWIKWYFLPLYGELSPLKYSLGPNFNLIPNSFFDKYKITLPFISFYKYDQQLFINNFNYSIFFIIIPLFAMLITFCRYRKYKIENMSIKIDEATQKRLYELQQYYIWACLGFLTGSLLNLQNYFSSLFLFFKSSKLLNIPSIIIISIAGILIFGNLIYFFRDPSMFDYFWFSFKKSKLLSHHIFIYISTLIIAIIMLVQLPNFNFLSIIPLLLLAVFTMIAKPYELNMDNSRSVFNIFVMCYCVIVKAWIQMTPIQLRKSIISAILLIINLLLLVATISFSTSMMFYHYYHSEYIEPITIKIIERIKRQKRFRVLNEMQVIDVNKKMKNVPQSSAFKNILAGKTSIKATSNQLKNILDEQSAMLAKQQKQQLIKQAAKNPLKIQALHSGEGTHNFKQTLKSIREQLIFSPTKKGQKLQYAALMNIDAPNLTNTSSNDSTRHLQLFIEDDTQIAAKALMEENIQINMLGVNKIVSKQKKKLDSQIRNVYRDAYAQIQ